MAPTALIVGASRGLGLGLVREYLARGWSVIGTTRGDGTGLHQVAHPALRIERAEVTDPASIAALRGRLAGTALELLFVNAGIIGPPGPVETGDFMRVMLTNSLGPLRVLEALAPAVTPAGTMAVMSSHLGSVAGNDGGGFEAYRASKAALNTLLRCFAAGQADGRSYLAMAPGWVSTGLGAPGSPLALADSVRGLADAIAARAGRAGVAFVDHTGATVPW